MIARALQTHQEVLKFEVSKLNLNKKYWIFGSFKVDKEIGIKSNSVKITIFYNSSFHQIMVIIWKITRWKKTRVKFSYKTDISQETELNMNKKQLKNVVINCVKSQLEMMLSLKWAAIAWL